MRAPDAPRNRLAGETSAYLVMHADDPVDWYPWSEEAFARAACESRPVFLSVGYASCHWCHVMQRESFRDAETAALLNERFVSVKVDREERPDVDAVYMDYVTASTGRGGWPMSVFLTAERLPILGGTYFPKHALGTTPAFRDVLEEVAESFAASPDGVARTAAGSRAFLEEQASPRASFAMDATILETAAEVAMRLADQDHGGFGDAPKFPQAPLLSFLLRFRRAHADREVAYQTRHALEAMLRGGIHDQAGGGLFRYATDAAWLVPHFEKMLYDQALLLSNLAEAYALEPLPEYDHAARRTAAFLDREMAVPDRGFSSALSAETEGVEGATYTWRFDELARILSAAELEIAERHLGVSRDGNWEGTNILIRPEGRTEDAEAVDEVLARILRARDARSQPPRDDKVVTSWNAMAARGLMEAGSAMGDEGMLERGAEVLRGLLGLAIRDGDVVHVLDDPSVAGVRLIEDYAHLAAACLTAHELAGVPRALTAAEELHVSCLDLFAEDGLLYMTPAANDLPVRPREQHDNPTPSGAATTLENSLRLSRATGRREYRDLVGEMLPQFWSLADYAPTFAGKVLLVALEFLEDT